MARPKKFTLQEIQNAQTGGDTAADVAKKVGCSDQTASRRLRQLDIQRGRGRPRLFTPEQRIELVQSFTLPLDQAAARHKCSVPAMRRTITDGVQALWKEKGMNVYGYSRPRSMTEVRIWVHMRNDSINRSVITRERIDEIANSCFATPADIRSYLERCTKWKTKISNK